MQPQKTGALPPTRENGAPPRRRYRKVTSSLFKSATGTLPDVTKHRRTSPNVTTASMHAPGVDDLDTAPPHFEDFQTFFELFSNACAKPFKKHAKTSIQKQRLTSRFYKQSETWLYIFSLPARSSQRERQAGNNKRH